eukprot:gene1451-32826_t
MKTHKMRVVSSDQRACGRLKRFRPNRKTQHHEDRKGSNMPQSFDAIATTARPGAREQLKAGELLKMLEKDMPLAPESRDAVSLPEKSSGDRSTRPRAAARSA